MDLTQIIRDAIKGLPDGPHQTGLRSVTNHIEVAMRHLKSGQVTADPSYFTDAVYRCNQAFEGSIKEAYRVLTGQDPSSKTTFDIENYLEDNDVLKGRVLTQLKRYRQEWRNPSTHDYTLDFDESEAFLAIVNIAAFAKVCIGQISTTLAYQRSKSLPAKKKPASTKTQKNKLIELIEQESRAFLNSYEPKLMGSSRRLSEGQVAGALGGHLSKIDHVEVLFEHKISDDKSFYADLLVKRGRESVIIELRSAKSKYFYWSHAVDQIRRYLDADKESEGLLVLYNPEPEQYELRSDIVDDEGRILRLVIPSSLTRSYDKSISGE